MSGKKFRKRLSAKEVPFLVTLFLAWAGWAIGHIVDRVVSSPTIEYKMVATTTGDKTTTNVYLTNLSQQAFFGLAFEVQGKDVVPCEKPLHNTPPAWPWNEAPKAGTGGVRFQVAQFHPDWEISMCTTSARDVETRFFLRETALGGGNSRQAVRLVAPSWETCFVRHEMALIIALFIFGSLMAVGWFFYSEPME